MGIATFYGALTSPRATTAETTDVVVQHARRCATTLFIIDDIHYLDMNRESATDVNNHLKMLMNETSATFIYAGVECSHTKLLTEGQPKNKRHLGQTRRRFARLPLKPLAVDKPEKRKEWQRLLNSIEKHLVLRDMKFGTLAEPSMAQYLHDRTSGYVGSLIWLIRYATARAIRTGTERITRELLDRETIDHASETCYANKRI